MVKLATLFTETGEDNWYEVVDVVEVPPLIQGYPPILVWDGRTFLRDGDETSGRYREVFGYVVRAREVRHHDDPR